MGAWGFKTFENDTALDFLTFVEHVGQKKIEDAFQVALDPPNTYLDADQSCEALAGAELIAARLGRPSDIPDEAHKLVDRITVTNELRTLASNAVDRVYRHSELRDLWSDGEAHPEGQEMFDNWKSVVLDLLERLK